jgi:hypothetical protein
VSDTTVCKRFVTLTKHDACILIEEGAKVTTLMTVGNVIEKAHLLALAIAWACENEEWKSAMMRRAKEKMEQIIRDEA